jgi:heat shock protein HslJ
MKGFSKYAAAILGATAVLAALSGCTSGAASPGASLEGTFWVLESYYNADAEDVTVLPRTQVTALLEGGKISGNDGCNNYFGEYTLEGSKLTFPQPMGSTMMACEEPVMAQAADFMQGLKATATFSISGQQLTFKDAQGKSLMVFGAASQELPGTSWQATFVNNGQEAMVGLITGTEITADFGEDGTVSGTAGCNRYNGPFETEGNQIKIGPLASTMMACIEPEGVSEQEAAYLAALENATVYELRGTNLTLRDADGAAQVEFVRE